ncbi:CapA family protein [Deinococcus oregonensis]|uniref:CapA family protein n=1 Tax=Deinococcus oregonensis TaxID=1805970 RepID=A0ABV6AW14_9DEIO
MRASSNALGAALLIFALTSGGSGPPSSVPLTFALAGDLSLARGVAQALGGNWNAALSGVRPALHADATLGNLESPLTVAPRRTAGIDLRADPAAVAALTGFTQLNTQNNHAQDGGAVGQAESGATLRRQGILPVTSHPTISRVRGVLVAWIGFFDDGRTAPPLAEVQDGAKRARVVIVAVHWGAEFSPVTARQRLLAHQLAAAGATLIVGSGPHVLQQAEHLHTARGQTLVLYSLGNLLFDQTFPAARVGAVVRVRWAERNMSGQQLEACAVPTRVRVGRVTLAPAAEAEQVLARLNLPACAGAMGGLP